MSPSILLHPRTEQDESSKLDLSLDLDFDEAEADPIESEESVEHKHRRISTKSKFQTDYAPRIQKKPVGFVACAETAILF